MENGAMPPTNHDNGSDDLSRMDKETGSPDVTTYTPGTKPEPKSRYALGSVMTSHLSAPPVQFGDGDEGNPRNWPPKRKMAIGAFVVSASFMA